jgi:hypothetical protein
VARQVGLHGHGSRIARGPTADRRATQGFQREESHCSNLRPWQCRHCQPASGEQMIQFFSGKSLSAFCEKSVDECTDYIIGVYDTLAMLHNSRSLSDDMTSICLPPTARDARLTLVVKKYLDDHRNQFHLAAPRIVISALTKAFP